MLHEARAIIPLSPKNNRQVHLQYAGKQNTTQKPRTSNTLHNEIQKQCNKKEQQIT